MGNLKESVQVMATETRPYAQTAIQSQVLMDMAGLLETLLQVELAGIPEIFRQYEVSVTAAVTQLDAGTISTMPWIAFVLYNDGPDPVYVQVNEQRNLKGPLNIGEQIRYDMKHSIIKRVYLQCGAGDTAAVRIYSEGKRYPENYLKTAEPDILPQE